jgi:hypothetical protein
MLERRSPAMQDAGDHGPARPARRGRPTTAAVNPTNTIQALALHIADTMKKNLSTLFD